MNINAVCISMKFHILFYHSNSFMCENSIAKDPLARKKVIEKLKPKTIHPTDRQIQLNVTFTTSDNYGGKKTAANLSTGRYRGCQLKPWARTLF